MRDERQIVLRAMLRHAVRRRGGNAFGPQGGGIALLGWRADLLRLLQGFGAGAARRMVDSSCARP